MSMKISTIHGRNKEKLDNTALTNYLEQKKFPIVSKEYKKYLLYEGIQDHHVYILKSGVIKTSVVSRDGREFNLEYINELEVVSLLNPKRPNSTRLTALNFGKISIKIVNSKSMSKTITENG
jgi:CRP-like cAMP-binding protein